MKPLLLAFAILAAASTARAQEMQTPPAPTAQEREAAARARAERRQRMIEECVANHGYEDDCVRAVDVELRAEGAQVIRLRPPR
jgi:hypothetical protein